MVYGSVLLLAAAYGVHPGVMAWLCSAELNLKMNASKPLITLLRTCPARREASKSMSACEAVPSHTTVVCAACSVTAYPSLAGDHDAGAGRAAAMAAAVPEPSCRSSNPVLP